MIKLYSREWLKEGYTNRIMVLLSSFFAFGKNRYNRTTDEYDYHSTCDFIGFIQILKHRVKEFHK